MFISNAKGWALVEALVSMLLFLLTIMALTRVDATFATLTAHYLNFETYAPKSSQNCQRTKIPGGPVITICGILPFDIFIAE